MSPRKLAIWLLIPAILQAQATPLWPGARYTTADRDRALERGLNFIYHTASDPKTFADWGHDLLWCFYTISATAKNPKLRDMAREMGHERALEWRRLHPIIPAKTNVDQISDLVYGSDAADRLDAHDPGFKQQLRNAVRSYSVTDFLLFDPAREPPPSDIPDQCAKCKRWNARGATVCRYCGAPLTMRDRYDVWTDALITTYTGEIYGITLGAPYRDVIRWISVMRPYPARASVSTDTFYNVAYAITHVIYTLNDYNRYLLSPEWLPQEFLYLKTNLEETVKLQDPETLGEFLDTLRDFGMTERDPLIRAGMEYVLSKQNPDGSWGDLTDTDAYTRYHSTWTAIDGLRQYGWHGKHLSFPGLEQLLSSAPAPNRPSPPFAEYHSGMAFEHSLSIRVVRKHADGVTVECPLRENLMNSTGVLHGGVIASIADEAAWHAMIHAYKGERPATTTELKVNYLRPITGKKMRARAYALRAGKTLFVTRVDLFDTQKRLSAVSLVTYMLLDSK